MPFLTTFADDIQRLTYELVHYYAICDRVCTEELSVTASQGYILMAMPERESITMNDLSAAMRLASSTMTRMVDQLVQKELVTREPDADDRRVVRVRLTDQGLDVRSRFKSTLQDLFTQVLQVIPNGERSKILYSLETLNGAIVQALRDCCGTELKE
jgi:DNA-binding MarR family transcriptional regulator